MPNRLWITTALVLGVAASAPGMPGTAVPLRIAPLDSLAANIVRIGFIPGAGELPVLAAASGWFGLIADILVLDPSGEEFSALLSDSSGTWAYCGWKPWPDMDGVVLVLAPPPYCLPDGLTASVEPGDPVRFRLFGYEGLDSPATALLTPSGTLRDLLPDPDGLFAFPADERGIYWVEVLSGSPNGPTVTLLFPVIAGGDAADVLRGDLPIGTPVVSSAEQILADLNARRRGAGLEALTRSPALDSIASIRATDLALSGSHDHLASGYGLAQMLPECIGAFGENLARGSGFREAWSMVLISPFHLRTCLSPDYSAVGIGAAVDWREGEWQLVLVQVFTGQAPPP